jgi:hypothetical protein
MMMKYGQHPSAQTQTVLNTVQHHNNNKQK